MASITKTATLYWGYDTYWNKADVASQGAWNATGSRTGAIYLPFGTTLKTAEISEIKFTATFGNSGWGTHTSKALSFYSSNYQTIDTNIQPQAYRKAALGTVSTPAYGNTATLTLSSSSNSALFSALKSYLEAGNTLVCIYNGQNANISSSYTFTQDYLTMTAMSMTVTYTPKYTLTLGKGTGISSVSGAGTYTSGTTVSASATPSTGYNFTKWTSGSSATSTQVSTANPYSFSLTSNTTLYAQAELKKYTISYNANGGSGAPSAQTKTHGTDITLSSTKPTRAGYTFAGWDTKSDGSGTDYAAGAAFATNANTTLYARWTVHVLTVKYNANGGTQGTGSSYTLPYTTTANYGTNYNGTDGLYDISTFKLTKTGYSASVWNTNTSGTGTSIDCTTSYTTQALASACGKDLSAGNVTLNFYPKWIANSYTVTYDGNGATEGSTANTSHTYGTAKALAVNGFTRSGYEFKEWNTKSDGSGTAYSSGQSVSNLTSTKNGTVTLYAIWTAWTYTIKYFPNEGTGTAYTSSHTYGVESNLTANKFTRENYTFLGWATSASGKVAYKDGAIAPSNITYSGAQISLYAVWSQNSPWTLSMVYVKIGDSWQMF